jgi:hypothetical protein
VKTSSITTSRLVLFSATLIALSAGIGAAPERADSRPDRTTPRVPSADFKAQIETLIQSWFAVLEDPHAEAEALNGLLAEAPFELVLDGTALHDRSSLLAWVSNLRSTYPQIEFRVDPFRIYAEGRDRYRIRFEFDRRALDDAGLAHVARREHTWIVRGNGGETPVILSIEERPLLFFPGTGPQVVCY